MEEVLFETEEVQPRSEIAGLLRMVADRLDTGEPLTLSAGDQSVTLDIPAQPTFEVKAEREIEGDATELSVEFEIEWDTAAADGDGTLRVE